MYLILIKFLNFDPFLLAIFLHIYYTYIAIKKIGDITKNDGL
jgi:hypothetical protein